MNKNYFFYQAYSSITCVDQVWYCNQVKHGCSNSLFNSTYSVQQGCPYTCGVCQSNILYNILCCFY